MESIIYNFILYDIFIKIKVWIIVDWNGNVICNLQTMNYIFDNISLINDILNIVRWR